MDKEALQLIRKLYSDNKYRQAIKLLRQYALKNSNRRRGIDLNSSEILIQIIGV